jgi:hypothetical protein
MAVYSRFRKMAHRATLKFLLVMLPILAVGLLKPGARPSLPFSFALRVLAASRPESKF